MDDSIANARVVWQGDRHDGLSRRAAALVEEVSDGHCPTTNELLAMEEGIAARR